MIVTATVADVKLKVCVKLTILLLLLSLLLIEIYDISFFFRYCDIFNLKNMYIFMYAVKLVYNRIF